MLEGSFYVTIEEDDSGRLWEAGLRTDGTEFFHGTSRGQAKKILSDQEGILSVL